MYYISGVTLWVMVSALITAAFTLALAFAFLLRCRYLMRLMDREIEAQRRTILELTLKKRLIGGPRVDRFRRHAPKSISSTNTI